MRPPNEASIKRRTVIIPLVLPVLTDKAAVQLLDLLREITAIIEQHYAEQAHRYQRRQRERRYQPDPIQGHLLGPDDPPF
jgi:hypothetical protein